MAIGSYLVDNPQILTSAALLGVLYIFFYSIAIVYHRRKKYPPGPFPWPIVGNLPIILTQITKKHTIEIFQDLSKQYGPVITFWVGPFPVVFAIEPSYIKEVFNKIDFAGRPDVGFMKESLFDGCTDIVFADYSREWEVLRQVTHSAIRKVVTSEKVPIVASETLKDVVDEIKTTHNINTPYNQIEYLNSILASLIGKLVFGTKMKKSDADYILLRNATKLFKESSIVFGIILFAPWMRHFFWTKYNRIKQFTNIFRTYHKNQYELHEKKFNPKARLNRTLSHDLTDALVDAKIEAEKDNSNDSKFLHSGNLSNVMIDMFLAGSETTVASLSWMFLMLANDPDGIQAELRKEVEDIIGNEIPSLEHKTHCHLLNSFISETLRYRTPIGLTIPHKALVDTNLFQYPILKGTIIFVSVFACSKDPNQFPEPEVFKPNRFIDENGKYKISTSESNIPFGLTGRRSCPGNKLALNEIFFILAGWFQNTKGLKLVLETGPGSADLRLNLNLSDVVIPNDYNVKLCPA